MVWVDVVQWVLGQISTNEKTQQAIFMVKTQQAINKLHQIFCLFSFFTFKFINPTHRICNEGKSLKILIGSSFIKLLDRSLQKQ